MRFVYKEKRTVELKKGFANIYGYVVELDGNNYIATISTIGNLKDWTRSFVFDNSPEAVRQVELLMQWDEDILNSLKQE